MSQKRNLNLWGTLRKSRNPKITLFCVGKCANDNDNGSLWTKFRRYAKFVSEKIFSKNHNNVIGLNDFENLKFS